MGRITARIIRGLAATTIAATASTLLAISPASAASHWTMDTDHVVLGASSTNSFKAFDGTVASFYDGTGSFVRAELTGPFVGRGTLKVTWTFHDGSTSTQSDYTAGVQHDINWYSNSAKTVVKFNFSYTPNSGDVDSKTFYVGDSPDSTGSCTRLDQNTINVTQTGYGSFGGNVVFGCNTSGHVTANLSGTASFANNSSVTNRAEVTIWYSDGSVELRTNYPLMSSSTTTSAINALSDPNRSVTWIGVRLHRWVNGTSDSTMPHKDVIFGIDL